MALSTVYVETTVIGHLVGRLLPNPIVAGRQTVTRLWWPQATLKHSLFVSRLVADECSAGDPTAAAERLAVVNALQFLAATDEAHQLAERFITGHAIPNTEIRDAVHISIAAIHGIEYLVTWNFKHIANPSTRSAIEWVCETEGYRPPIICTPDELSEI